MSIESALPTGAFGLQWWVNHWLLPGMRLQALYAQRMVTAYHVIANNLEADMREAGYAQD